uniref:Uncharacterized protein n=2 Tax=unclassified Caudoviricetes TaxID=2788787 RepID=A0A8S5PJF0_9CAUD|nr:MAG TPA: hypothetical protein [Siphoviridae sp. ctJcm18]DAE06595.1 MAG TPA: hypothetical protein [Siphoviridae sp. ctUGQ45]
MDCLLKNQFKKLYRQNLRMDITIVKKLKGRYLKVIWVKLILIHLKNC